MNKKTKTILVTVIVILLSIILVFAGVKAYQNKHQNIDADETIPSTTVDQWVEDYDYRPDDKENIKGYEDVSLPPIVLEQ